MQWSGKKRFSENWSKSWLDIVYKGKGNAMKCGSYRGIKLLEHETKVSEQVIEAQLRRNVKIDDMKFGFQPGNSTRLPREVLRWEMREVGVEEQIIRVCKVNV